MSVATLRYEAPDRHKAPAAGTNPHAAAVLQRGRGAAEIVFARRGARTVLADLYQRTPCRVLFPRIEDDDTPLAVLLTTSGGLAGGDSIDVSIAARRGAAATVTSQAAEKIYRSLGPATVVAVDLTVEDDAWLEYLPQETILFDDARLERRTSVAVAPAGRFLAAEMLVFGRAAHGERFARGLLHDVWRVRCGGRLAWADALHLEGDIAALLDGPFAFDGATALATALYVGGDAAVHLDAARDLAEKGTSRGAATLIGGTIVARFLGPRAGAVREDLGRFLAGLRCAAAGLPARLPRLWHG